ncbi:hypothetical protein DFH09DRAFT_1439750 [Mycena vulgaris]|nr:hypothetical protein DFH09DRAFT_1439750 [Mycena vulgaris]
MRGLVKIKKRLAFDLPPGESRQVARPARSPPAYRRSLQRQPPDADAAAVKYRERHGGPERRDICAWVTFALSKRNTGRDACNVAGAVGGNILAQERQLSIRDCTATLAPAPGTKLSSTAPAVDSGACWQHGDDVDVEQSIAAQRLLVLTGVTLCISGITDIVRRTQINKLITAGGGTYVKALERPVRITHLLCSGEDETDKMRFADKFNRAGEADPPIQLVWEEFPGLFGIRREIRRGAVPSTAPPDGAQGGTFSSQRKRKHILTITASKGTIPTTYEDDDDGDKFLPVKQHLPDVTLQLWGSLLKARGYEVAGGGVMLSPRKACQMAVQERAAAGDELPEGGSGSVLSRFCRTNSYVAPRTTAAAAPRMLREPSSAGAGPSRLPFGRSGSANGNSAANSVGPSSSRVKRLGEGDATQAADHAAPAPAPNAAPADEPSTVFAGLKFLLRGETETAPVHGAIEGAGSTIIGERGAERDVDYIIVRLVSGSALYLAEPSSVARARYCMECWLKCCLFADFLCAPSTHVSFVPLGVSLPIPGAYLRRPHNTQLLGPRHVRGVLRITLAPAFSRHTTHLLCPGGTSAKYARARQWGMPIVDMGWLAAMAQHGAVPDVQVFLVLPGDAAGEEELDVPAEGHKGKGKEKEKAEEAMQDITNNYDSQDSQPKQEVFFLPPPLLARPSFGNPGPALGFPGEAWCGADAFDAQPAEAAPVDGHASSSSSSSARPGPSSGAAASAVRRAAMFGAASRVMSSLPARVPSSASPSPLRRGVSISPPKISDERTKALQETITSLLGKLPAVPEDDAPALGRAGKRNITVINSAWQPSGASGPLHILAYTLSRAA